MGDATTVKQVFDIPARQRLDPAFLIGLASMKAIHVDETRFKQKDDISAVVPIITTDGSGETTTWKATLVLIGGSWRIALTDEGKR